LESLKVLSENPSKNSPTRIEQVFPEDLKDLDSFQKKIEIKSENKKRFLVYSFEELLELKEKNPSSKIVAGNTEIGIEQRLLSAEYNVLISPMGIAEMKFITLKENFLQIGSLTTLSEMLSYLKNLYEQEIAKQKQGLETNIQRAIRPIIKQIKYFSGTSIRYNYLFNFFTFFFYFFF
jgi:xanthine dehydrogenase/oxidase